MTILILISAEYAAIRTKQMRHVPAEAALHRSAERRRSKWTRPGAGPPEVAPPHTAEWRDAWARPFAPSAVPRAGVAPRRPALCAWADRISAFRAVEDV